jgi:hypothetical protein
METHELALHAAASFWQVSATAITASDITAAKFPWSRLHTFFLAMSEDRRRLLVSVDRQQSVYPFQPLAQLGRLDLAAPNLVVLNSILDAEGVRLPSGIDLPWTLRNVLIGLGGWVASRSFFEAEESALGMWTANVPQNGPQLFEQLCSDPRQLINGANWRLEFRYFNLSGAVEAWTAEGSATRISSFDMRELFPARTFFVPYA